MSLNKFVFQIINRSAIVVILICAIFLKMYISTEIYDMEKKIKNANDDIVYKKNIIDSIKNHSNKDLNIEINAFIKKHNMTSCYRNYFSIDSK